MGYYTRYSIAIHSEPVERSRIDGIDANGNPSFVYVERKLSLEDIKYQISNECGYNTLWEESVKWYDHEKDMRDFSRKYPEVVFELSGEGEENGDIWKAYFKNGKMQRCKAIITFDSFDEAKMK